MKIIQKTAIIGMGALGLMYGAHITQQLGPGSVDFVLDEDRFISYQKKTFTVNGRPLSVSMVNASKARPYDLVIVAVKYNSLPSAIETMKKCIGEQTIILSVMNGISSEKILSEHFGMDKMIDTVAQAMDAMRDGNDLHYTQMGILCIGTEQGQQPENLDAVLHYFDRIQLPYQVEENIRYRMWAKWMLNVGVNQTCMVYQTTYSGVLRPGEAHDRMVQAMEEVVALSKYAGVFLKDTEVDHYIHILETLDPDGYPSMEQDRRAGRRTEVEMFAGMVLQMARQYQISAPANQYLYDHVLELEKNL